MLNQRQRAIVRGVLVLALIWTVAATGFFLAKRAKMTAAKVRDYVTSVDLGKLSGADRVRAIHLLADKINALSLEERRRMRMERTANRWFDQMTEEEKAAFIEATMPTGFKQMLTAFEQMPEESRRKAVDDALRRLREASSRMQAGAVVMQSGTNRPPPISEDLQAKVRTIGLETFYSQSSAQTKAELAPVLEELQRVMESGAPFRGR